MRQYCGWLLIIAINLLIPGINLAAGSINELDATLPDYLWYREAAEFIADNRAEAAVDVSNTRVDGNMLSTDIEVRPNHEGNNLTFVMAVPDGDITSAAITVNKFSRTHQAQASRATAVASQATTSVQETVRTQVVIARHLAYIRGHRLVRIEMPTNVAGEFGSKLESGLLNIAFRDPVSTATTTFADDLESSGPVYAMLREFVVNPDDLEGFRLPLDQVPAATDNAGVPLGHPGDAVARFEITREGFASFTGADLERAGINTGDLRRDQVSVWTDGEQQPVHVMAADDAAGTIDAADRFILYGRDNQSTYSATRTYWVRTDVPALPMQTFPDNLPYMTAGPSYTHFQATTSIEEDTPPVLTQNDQFLSILDYRWVWWAWTMAGDAAALPGPRPYTEPGTVQFDLPGLAHADTSAALKLHFYAHHWKPEDAPISVRVELNNQFVESVKVTPEKGLIHQLSVPAGLLKADGNHLALAPEVTSASLSGRALPDLCFDNVQISYPRTFELTSNVLQFHPPSSSGGLVDLYVPETSATQTLIVADVSSSTPTIIHTGHVSDTGNYNMTTNGPLARRYVAALAEAIPAVTLNAVAPRADLRATSHAADLVVIAWPEFMEAMGPWIVAKAAAGHAVKMVDVHDVYDQFGYGHQSPHAIREFLRYAALNWQGSPMGPAVSSVLLVGDSTSAYRNEFRNEVINYVPTMRIFMKNDIFASDQWYVSFFGDDIFTDAMIGRFSVNSAADLKNIVRKQLDYERNVKPATWQNTLGFVADHSEFEATVDRVIQRIVPQRFFLDRIMMSELPWIDNYYFPSRLADEQQAKVSPAATQRIRDMFSRGAAVVTYFGHGSPNIWSTERMWFGGDSPNSDNLLLTNRDRLSIVINMTCNSGAIDYPQPRWNVCISEDFMRVPNGGAVACFVPSGPGLTIHHERLMTEIGKTLFEPRREMTLGESMYLALWRYLAEGNPEALARMYILLGDPLIVPRIAPPFVGEAVVAASDTKWPGTVSLPPDIAAKKSGGTYQFKFYDEKVTPGSLTSFTTSAVALTIPPGASGETGSLALSVASDDGISSTFLPVEALRGVVLAHWRRIETNESSVTLELRIRNDTALPIRNAKVALGGNIDSSIFGMSEPITIMPHATESVHVNVNLTPGLQQVTAYITSGSERVELESELPIALAGLRPDSAQHDLPPAEVDPRSVSIKYRVSGETITAAVSATVYSLAREPLSNLRVALQDASGAVVPGSSASIPPLSPSMSSQVHMRLELPKDSSTSEYFIRFDPSGFYPEFTRFPMHKIVVGKSQFPDVAILSVKPDDPTPTDGQTVFFDAVVANLGATRVDGVQVRAHDAKTSDTVPLPSQVNLKQPMFSLDPGEKRQVRLRWDPFKNAGMNTLRFTAANAYGMPEIETANNTLDVDLVVRSKGRLRSVRAGVLRPSPGDYENRRLRFLARVQNEGETAMHGLRVLFYSSPDKTDDTFLGETEIDTILPGETKDSILTYILKPGEDDRPFNISFEVMYKGSRQRLLQ